MAKICGVYCIFNKVNKKLYIGSSTNINKRWTNHLSKLNRNQCPNIYLQAAWNKYGKHSFEFIILIECSKNLLLFNEQLLINNFNVCDRTVGYNLAKFVGLPGKGSIKNRGAGNGKAILNENQVYEIKVKLRDGYSVAELANEYHVTVDSIYAIKQEKRWKHIKVEGYIYNPKKSNKGKSVIFISPQGIKYETNNINKFAKEHNLCSKNLGQVVRGNSYSYKGWLGFYKDEELAKQHKFIHASENIMLKNVKAQVM